MRPRTPPSQGLDQDHSEINQYRHIRLPGVVDIVGCSSRCWLRWVKQGQAPGAVRLGPGVVAWRLKDVVAWLESKATGEAA